MPSILADYEYDIFISYRQKDNEYDGWVTEFVDNLRHELSATFKENISIYFDENPEDGLLESHDVDQSLKTKIKSLIFIPIVSQTYCDPNCYAWQKEFLAFRDFAKDDQYGLDIKLTNDNVSKRILPIRIHEIDEEDKQLFENESGGVLRAIDFIYEEPGVNRPLKPDDSKEDNLLKIRYRNQVNKTSNAIKELIYALQHKPFTSSRNPTIETVGHRSLFDDKSIAVLPFTNMSSDKDQDYFCDGIAEDILNDLTQIEGLNVAARTSSFALKDRQLDIREIGSKLGVTTILEGSVQKSGNTLRITAQLNNVSDGYHVWSNRYDREIEDVFAIKDEIAQSIVKALAIKLSSGEKQKLEKVKTQNIQAFDFYMRGRDYFHQAHEDKILLAIPMFRKAIQKDKNYALAYTGLADSYSWDYMYFDNNIEILQQALTASQKALELDPELAEAHSSLGIALAQNKQYKEAEKEFETAIQLNPKLFDPYYEYGRICRSQGKHDQAAKLFEKAVQIEPDNYHPIAFLTSAYEDLNMETKMYKANQRALEVFRKHLDLNPDDARALYLGAGALITAEEPEEALEWVKKAILLEPKEIVVLYNAACIYSLLGKVDEAINYFEKAIETGYASMDWIENDSDLDPIRDHPRFIEILEKIN